MSPAHIARQAAHKEHKDVAILKQDTFPPPKKSDVNPLFVPYEYLISPF